MTDLDWIGKEFDRKDWSGTRRWKVVKVDGFPLLVLESPAVPLTCGDDPPRHNEKVWISAHRLKEDGFVECR